MRHAPRAALRNRVVATLVAVLVIMVTTVALPTPAVADDSANGDFTVTKTASQTSVPAGGGSVTYTYTVRNNTAGRQYYVSGRDDKCSPLKYVGGMTTTSDGWFGTVSYIPASGTATWTCTQTVTQFTMNTATFQFANSYSASLWGRSYSGTETGTAKATVGIAQQDISTCSALWYSGDESGGFQGTAGVVNTARGATTSVFDIGDNSAAVGYPGYQSSAAMAVDPSNPHLIYYVPRDLSSWSWAPLQVYDTSTRTAKLVTTQKLGVWVRLGADPSGRLWSITDNGHAYRLDPRAATPTWEDRGLVTLPSGYSWGDMQSGDLAFDGRGTMYFIGSAVNSGVHAVLFTITMDQLTSSARVPKAQLVGNMGDIGFNGIALLPDGRAFATTREKVYSLDITTGTPTLVGDSRNAFTTDLGSCALPKAELNIEKKADPSDHVTAGGAVTYTVTIENTGTLAATGVTFTDIVGAGQSVTSATLNGGANLGSTWYNTARSVNSPGELAGIIAPGDTATVRLTTKVTDANATKVCNQGTVHFTGGPTGGRLTDDPDLPGDTDATCVPVLRPAIALDKTGSTTQLAAGGAPTDVTYTYAVTNPATEPLTTVALSDDKCSPLKLVSGDTDADGVLTTDETWLYRCTQTLTQATTNRAVVTGVGVQSKVKVEARDTWTVSLPPLTLDKTSSANGQPVRPGDTVTYTMTVTNVGAVDQTNVTLDDTLPAGLTYVAGSSRKTYPTDASLPSTGTWQQTLPTQSWDNNNRAELRQTFTPTGLPAGATLTGSSVTINGAALKQAGTNACGLRENAYVWGARPGQTGATTDSMWFAIDQYGTYLDADNDEFGTGCGRWNTVTRTNTWAQGSGPAANGTYSIWWGDWVDSFSGGNEQTGTATVRLDWHSTNPGSTRTQATDAARAPGALVTAADKVTLKPGEKMTVTLQATVNADAPASLLNAATADSDQAEPVRDDVTDPVVRPLIDVAKTAGAVSAPDAQGVSTATYTITVRNTGSSAGTYGPLTDTPRFDADATPVSATWSGQASGNATLTNPASFTVGAATTPLAAGATHTYQVSVRFTVAAGGDLGVCAGAGTGLYNSVSLPAGQEHGTTDNNAACATPAPRFAVAKTASAESVVASHDAASGTYTATATYTVSVRNTGSVAAPAPQVTDTPTPSAGFTVRSVTVNGAAATLAGGSLTLPAGTQPVNPGATTTHTVVMVVVGSPTPQQWTAAATCDTQGAGRPGTGLFNLVSMAGDADGADNNDACVKVTPPTAVIHVAKQGVNCDVDQAVCALPGAQFALYTTDPTGGAAALADGVTPDAGGATFTSTGLVVGQEYWLVETKAPAGFVLLADPIRFRLTATGVVLGEGSASSLVALKSGDPYTVVVSDTTPAPLPESGGDGPWLHLGGGLLLLATAALYLRRSPRPSKPAPRRVLD